MTQLNLDIKTKLDALQAALLESHPQIPTLLRDIHQTLKAQPEQVTLMSEDEIHIVIQGLEKQTNSHLAAAVSKATKSPAKKKALAANTASDLGFD